MIEIASLADRRVGEYAHVGEPAWLEANGLFVAEGRLVVRRLVADARFALHSILGTPTALASIADLGTAITAPVYACDQATLSGVTGFNFHRGCLALARRGEPASLDSLLGAPVLVAMEGVGNPDNVGGIFRTALALGAGGVVLDPASDSLNVTVATGIALAQLAPFSSRSCEGATSPDPPPRPAS